MSEHDLRTEDAECECCKPPEPTEVVAEISGIEWPCMPEVIKIDDVRYVLESRLAAFDELLEACKLAAARGNREHLGFAALNAIDAAIAKAEGSPLGARP